MKYKVIKKEFIFKDDRPFESCHASTLLLLPNSRKLCAWFGGTREGADDVAIWLSKYEEGLWSYPEKVADEEGIPHWNPVLFRRMDGTICLFYQTGHEISQWKSKMIFSKDQGRIWSSPIEIEDGHRGGRGPIKNKPLLLENGTWLAPSSKESKEWNAFVDISRDEGLTWTKSNTVPVIRRENSTENESKDIENADKYLCIEGRGIIQPSLWESSPGIVHMLLRSTEGKILRSDSKDSGMNWCPVYATDLPNNNSGIDLVKLENGVIVLVCNPIKENWGFRTPLVTYISYDNGETWGDKYILEDEPGEYSYPAIVEDKGLIYITYTWKRERVAFWEIELEKTINN